MALMKLLCTFVLLLAGVNTATAGCDGTETFEKVLEATVQTARQIPLYSSQEGPITAECNNRCRNSGACPAYVINYDRSACYRLDVTSQKRNQLLQPVIGRAAFFQKICLRAPACRKAWVFDRVPDHVLTGHDDLLLEGVTSRRHCQERCLQERSLPCRSAEYVEARALCRVSAADRHAAPLSLRPAPGTEYMENLCAQRSNEGSCDWEEMLDSQVAFPDLQLDNLSLEQCREACETAAEFHCRSFTVLPDRSTCLLSSEDSLTAGSQALTPNAAAITYQRTDCLNLELTCAADQMMVRLSTQEPFSGRIFALDAPSTCEVRGSGQLTTEATFRYADSRCGVVQEGTGSYTALVVVQHHALIQRRSDRATKLLCAYDIADQTVSTGVDLIVDRIENGLVAATVNATAPTPRVALYVRDVTGADVTGAQLGDRLLLSLELDDFSIFGMFARSLVARGGVSGESIVLLDDRGCPTEEAIFEGFRERRSSSGDTVALVAPFEAFKFSGDPVVRFQVNVQFCLEECAPAQCSPGQRERRSLPGLDPLTLQPTVRGEAPLQRELVVEGGRVRRRPVLPSRGLGAAPEELLCARGPALAGGATLLVILQACLLLCCWRCLLRRRQKRLQESLPATVSAPLSSRQRLQPLQPSRPARLHTATLQRLRSIAHRY